MNQLKLSQFEIEVQEEINQANNIITTVRKEGAILKK